MSHSSLTRTALLIISIIYLNTIVAQSAATFDVSQVFSTFKYIDDKGNTDKDYTANMVNAYNLGYLFSSQKGLLLGLNIGIREAGASKEVTGASFVWNLHYAEVRLLCGYMLNKWRCKPYILISPYYAGLLQASQTINEINYDIKKDNAVANYDYGLIASGGINVKLSDFISLYSCYNQIYGVKNIQTIINQQSYNRGFSLSLGVALTITKTAPKWIQ